MQIKVKIIFSNFLNKILSPSTFLKNVMTLSFGSIISQGIGFLFLPILSRLYSPHEFGLFYSFTGIAQIACLISTLKYEKSIILPEDEKKGDVLALLTLIITCISSIIMMLLIFILKSLNIYLGAIQDYIYLIPLSSIVYALTSILILWFQRKEKFFLISIINITMITLIMLSSVIIGYFKIINNGLIISYVLGCLLLIIGIVTLCYKKFINIFKLIEIVDLKNSFFKYIDFPKYYLAYDLLLSGIGFIIPFLIASLFSEQDCGMYSMAIRILNVPYIIISISVSNVFLVNAKKEFQKNNSFGQLYLNTLKKLFVLGLVIYSLGFIIGGRVISIVLGTQWEGIQPYVQVISIVAFFEFVAYVFRANTYIIVQKQKIGLIIQSIYSILSISVLVITSSKGFFFSIITFSVITIAFAILNLYVTYNYAKTNSASINA
jgi:O-antigen/teichoic acid export membrane protein